LVSIITPSFNSKNYIGKTIESVISQEYQDWEMIIVDDFSTDDSVVFIEEYCEKDARIKLISLPENKGPGIVRNIAIKEAKGRYIAFLDSDDLWTPNKLQKQILFMEQGDLPFTYTQYYEFSDQTGKILSLVKSPRKVDYKKILKNGYIGCLTVIYDTEKLGKRYMPEIRKRQDWSLWINILSDIDYALGIQEPLAYYRVGNSSISQNKLTLIKHNFNVYRIQLKFSFIKSTLLMLNFLIHYFIFKKFGVKKINGKSITK